MSAFRIDAKGLRPIEKRLWKLLNRFDDLLPLMDVLGRYLVDSSRHRFETSTAPDGAKWKESARAKHDGGKTLVLSGQLRDSITHLPGADRVEVGTNKVYAAVHQFGATIVPKQASALVFALPDGAIVHAQQVIIPARPYIGISPADVRALRRLTKRYAAQAVGEAG